MDERLTQADLDRAERYRAMTDSERKAEIERIYRVMVREGWSATTSTKKKAEGLFIHRKSFGVPPYVASHPASDPAVRAEIEAAIAKENS